MLEGDWHGVPFARGKVHLSHSRPLLKPQKGPAEAKAYLGQPNTQYGGKAHCHPHSVRVDR